MEKQGCWKELSTTQSRLELRREQNAVDRRAPDGGGLNRYIGLRSTKSKMRLPASKRNVVNTDKH